MPSIYSLPSRSATNGRPSESTRLPPAAHEKKDGPAAPQLPDNILRAILRLVDDTDLLACRAASKHLQRLCEAPSAIRPRLERLAQPGVASDMPRAAAAFLHRAAVRKRTYASGFVYGFPVANHNKLLASTLMRERPVRLVRPSHVMNPVRLLEVRHAQAVMELPFTGSGLEWEELVISPDGQFASGYDLTSREKMRRVPSHKVVSLPAKPRPFLGLSCFGDRPPLQLFGPPKFRPCFSLDTSTYAFLDRQGAHVYDTGRTFRPRAHLAANARGPGGDMSDLILSPDGRYLAVFWIGWASARGVDLMDTADGTVRKLSIALTNEIGRPAHRASLSARGRFYAEAEGSQVFIRDWPSAAPPIVIKAPEIVRGIAFSPSCDVLAVRWTTRSVRLFAVVPGAVTVLRDVPTLESQYCNLTWSMSGRMLLCRAEEQGIFNPTTCLHFVDPGRASAVSPDLPSADMREPTSRERGGSAAAIANRKKLEFLDVSLNKTDPLEGFAEILPSS